MTIEKNLKQINARVAACQNYNFGMTVADRVAHKDAPAMLRALTKAVALIDALEVVEAAYPNESNASAKFVASLLRDALSEVEK